MFDLFSPRAKKAFDTARTLAKVDRLRLIRADHVLHGILSDEESAGAKILTELCRTSVAKIRETMVVIAGGITFEKITQGETNEPSYSPEVKLAIERSAKEAEGRSDVIGTEHVLLALLSESTGVIAATIAKFEMNIEDLYKVASEFVGGLAQGMADGKTGTPPIPDGEQLGVIAVLQPGLPAASIDRVMDAIAMLRGVAAVDIMRVRVKEKEEEKSPILTGKMATPDRRILR